MSATSLVVSDRETGTAINQRSTHPCQHEPRCPSPVARDGLAAKVVAAHPEQGWSLLCNGVIAFEDGGTITAQGQATGVNVPDRVVGAAWRTVPAAI